jgi:hypothetical protein
VLFIRTFCQIYGKNPNSTVLASPEFPLPTPSDLPIFRISTILRRKFEDIRVS